MGVVSSDEYAQKLEQGDAAAQVVNDACDHDKIHEAFPSASPGVGGNAGECERLTRKAWDSLESAEQTGANKASLQALLDIAGSKGGVDVSAITAACAEHQGKVQG